MKKYFLILFLLAFQNCLGKSSLIIIQPDTELKNINLSQVGKKSSLVKLQSGVVLAEPSHILCSKNYIYFIDQNYSQQVFQFDRKGKLLKKISFLGDQKYDINGISSVFLENEMIRMVLNGNRILKFDLELNSYETQNLAYKAGYLLRIDDEYLAFNNYLENAIQNHIYWLDSVGKNNSKPSLPIDSKMYRPIFKMEQPFNRVDGELWFSKIFDDTIYVMQEKGNFKPKYFIDFGADKIPSDFLLGIETGTQFYQKMREDKHYSNSGGVHSAGNGFAIINVFHQLYTYPMVVDLKTNTSKLVDRFVDDLNSGIKVRQILFSDEEAMVFGISGENLSLQLDNVYPETKSNLSPTYEDDYFLIVVEK